MASEKVAEPQSKLKLLVGGLLTLMEWVLRGPVYFFLMVVAGGGTSNNK